jgi:hypothetical protein
VCIAIAVAMIAIRKVRKPNLDHLWWEDEVTRKELMSGWVRITLLHRMRWDVTSWSLVNTYRHFWNDVARGLSTDLSDTLWVCTEDCIVCLAINHRLADNSRPLSCNVSAWERVYAKKLSRLQTETKERERERSKRHVGVAHSVLTAALLSPQRLSCYWGKTVSLRMPADSCLRTAQQRTTGQDLLSDLYCSRMLKCSSYLSLSLSLCPTFPV